ncbi:MAG: zinc metallopeptidase [Betaproteobacteria bacterium]|nr:zinc metallopeptidase [Betaproteobacteria bacterium]
MRLDDQRQSDNLEDRRAGGGGSPISGRLGIGGIIIALIASYFLGINPMTVLGLLDQAPSAQQAPVANKPPADDAMANFVSRVLASTEDTWRSVFQQAGQRYQDPKLVLFSGSTPTACGTGKAAMGPFYCPGDQKVYIDLAFYRDLKDRFRAPGEFAQAYVIAHEVGHHVQHLLGISDKVHAARQRQSEAQANAMSVRLELQADCFAGVWGKSADTMKKMLEPGEIEQALTAAAAIGDDRLQQQGRGTVVPESFTHGTSAQRVRWFKRGFDSGDPKQCDAFQAAQL